MVLESILESNMGVCFFWLHRECLFVYLPNSMRHNEDVMSA